MSSTDPVETHECTLHLRDGRTLGYTIYGMPTGKTLLYFGGSRLEAEFLARPAQQAGIRLIGIDRPGMGRSQFQEGRRLLDWPADVVEVADHLQIDRFAVVGLSGGGPYALACAYSIPDRLTACGIVSGVGPIRVRFYQRLPWLLIPIMWVMSRFFQNEEQARSSLTHFTRSWPEPDRKSLLAPEIRDLWTASMVEAFRQGARGLTYDTLLGEGRSWGFKLEDVAFPTMYLWHGELDQDVPIVMGRAVARRLPHCQATYYPGEGHISLIVNYREEIVTTLMAEARTVH
ncbi:alpha/beta hydrolase [Ktedonobacter sp. SOSP1-52]|uniref:alpha/beta fold hydrolase n=1 Tax=Ktedonobacter sp. SOSP1-52 TaxID=2778366 RepID=UPI0019152D20|nr:alpha/beta hydrolase [Ktedonobacter sp. SOSP1-52]GHO63253.1 alpha/beta hydrolase [Ktedonobacter sp. SOSP1-52]